MAGGPIFPVSAVPADAGAVFPGAYVKSDRHIEGLGVVDATTLAADATWRLVFRMPESLPSGTATLSILSYADATSGALKVNPKWKSVAVEEDVPLPAALNAEGTQTVTWGAGDDLQAKETTVTLDADTVVAGEIIHLDVVFEDTGTTLATNSYHVVSIIWV